MTEDTGGLDLRKRQVHRSPGYPGLSLPEAIERVRTIYEAEKRALTSADVLATDLGLNPKTGPANRVISALRQFGLLEEPEPGRLGISKLGFDLVHLSEGSADREELLKEAAVKPTLIAEILKKFPTGLPSDTAIQDFLLRDKNFNPASVEFFVKVLRKTIKFARLDNPADSQFVQSGESDIGYLEEAKRTDMPSGQHRSSVAPQPVIEGVEIPYFSFTLKGITVEFRASGPLQREHLELIRAHLDAYASPSSSKSD